MSYQKGAQSGNESLKVCRGLESWLSNILHSFGVMKGNLSSGTANLISESLIFLTSLDMVFFLRRLTVEKNNCTGLTATRLDKYHIFSKNACDLLRRLEPARSQRNPCFYAKPARPAKRNSPHKVWNTWVFVFSLPKQIAFAGFEVDYFCRFSRTIWPQKYHWNPWCSHARSFRHLHNSRIFRLQAAQIKVVCSTHKNVFMKKHLIAPPIVSEIFVLASDGIRE